MNCFDCHTGGEVIPALAICVDCGAGLCNNHLTQRPVQRYRNHMLGQQLPTQPLGRVMRCHQCDAAHINSTADNPRAL